MRTFSPEFKYRGDRKYVHGTDLYIVMMQGLEELGLGIPQGRVAINLRHLVQHQPEVWYGEPGAKAATPDGALVDFQLEVAGGDLVGWFVETDRPVHDSVPYNEEKIRNSTLIESQSIQMESNTSFAPIEVFTSMAVHLHNTVLPPEGGKWVFTRLSISRPLVPEDTAQGRLELKKNFNNRLTDCEVFSGQESLGHIFFSFAGFEKFDFID